MKNHLSAGKPGKENYIGNIQVSKGMLWAKLKRAQEEAESAKLLNKIFPNKGSFLTKKNQTFCVSERHSVKSTSSVATVRSSFTVRLKTNSPLERSPKDSGTAEPKPESKLMAQSKKISKYQPPTQGLQYKRLIKKPTTDISIKMPRKTFKEDTKRGTSQNGRDGAAKTKTAVVAKSLDLKSLSSSGDLIGKDVQFNKYRAAMRVRKVPCDTLKYRSASTKREHKFKCFKEKDLNIPRQYSSKIIHHNMDNDCYTDEEQTKLAIKNLYFSLRLAHEEIV